MSINLSGIENFAKYEMKWPSESSVWGQKNEFATKLKASSAESEPLLSLSQFSLPGWYYVPTYS